MKKITFFAISLCLIAMAIFTFATPAQAIDLFPQCSSNPGTTLCSATSDKLFGVGGFWNRILETFTFIIGAISVLMIIIGGIRYTTSNGEQAQVTSAKNTIIYSVVGLIVAIMSYGIVRFVISNI
ncbi:MAG TPA: hypothetical protein VFO38_01200 [Candidatus Saccharimonadales bacterium]|nr:hypothetical protein [Candidatus Saccharimonadales bacterium]